MKIVNSFVFVIQHERTLASISEQLKHYYFTVAELHSTIFYSAVCT